MKKEIRIVFQLAILIGISFLEGLKASSLMLPVRPAQLIVSPNDTICQGQKVTLSLKYPTGNLQWSTGATTDSIFVTPGITSSYYVINDFGGSLQDTFFVTITVFQDVKPIVSVAPTGIICKGDSVFFTLTNPFNNILWSTNNTSAFVTLLADTLSEFFVINDAGGKCPDTNFFYILIRTKNYTLIDIHGGICPGSEVNINIINPAGTVSWNTGSNSPYLIINPYVTTTYTLINNASSKCADTLAVEIFVAPEVKPQVSIFPTDSICEGDNLSLRILNPFKTFYWSNGSSDTIQYVQAGLNSPLWVVNDYNGFCPDTTLIHVEIINIDSDLNVPNCFSPNGDKINDVFKVGEVVRADYKISIYNRWGLKVFESDDNARDWDGTVNGTPVVEGMYYWILDFHNYCGGKTKTKKGFVSLFR